eukprot:TRINITY_DN9792_c0_g1_i2.p2 TRINITY_DN9792_c0_g1~~TRINITY_DN9792_c0_g1_i2.p2  ORF type:complete len:225 (+),score=38.40 TRINITY_DN9792_c0_g1_i2:1699-2373(+)
MPASVLRRQQSVMEADDDHAELLYKVLVVGDMGVGKTSIIKRYVHNIFSQNYKATIGVDFGLKELHWEKNTIRVQLWDIAGQERFGNLTRVYYKEAVGALVVHDITKADSLEAATKWKNDIDHKVYLPDDTPIPCVLLSNKCDMPNRIARSQQEMDKFCKDHGFIAWFETSAKENRNIDAACSFLVQKILEKDPAIPVGAKPNVPKDSFGLGASREGKAKKCCV